MFKKRNTSAKRADLDSILTEIGTQVLEGSPEEGNNKQDNTVNGKGGKKPASSMYSMEDAFI
jgi:hypothetical protein